jgi:hypothetical protein
VVQTPLLDAALRLAALGWYVFPLQPGSKLPAGGSRGHLDATTDESTIRAWWQAEPCANLGLSLAPSGLIAIDADGEGWRARIATLEAEHGALPTTLIQHSGGGNGIHAIFRAPPFPIRGSLGGLTLRGRNYLVIAPSVHPSGGTYRWHDPDAVVAELPEAWAEAMRRRVTTESVEVPEPHDEPDWLRPLSALARLEAAREHVDREAGEVMRLAPGVDPRRVRPGMTFDVMRSICRGYAVRDVAEAFKIAQRYNARCEPPWDERKLARLVENAYDAATPEWGQYLRPYDPSSVLGFTPTKRPPTPPDGMRLRAELKAAAGRAARSTRGERKLEADILRRVLGGKTLIEPGDEPEAALERACVVVIAAAPPGTTDEQVAAVVARSALGATDLPTVIARARSIVEAPEANDDPDEFDLEVAGPRAGRPSATSQKNIPIALRRLGVSVRQNLLSDEVIITRNGIDQRATDAEIVSLLLEVDREFEFRPPKEFFFDVIGDRARADAFHPVCDYLDSLQWDGTPRIDTWLTRYAGADDTDYTRAVGALILVAAVRRARQPGAKFDEMLVLEAPQGTLKSSALRVLAVRDEWFGDDLPLSADTKRQIEAISGKWIVEAGELQGLRRSEEDELKAFLSRQHDEARLAYGRLVTRRLRQCVFFGTTNNDSYLKDPTGNRRWWPVRIVGFDSDALLADRDQLWAEASAREHEGGSVRLPRHLWDAAAKEQEDRRVDDPFVEVLEQHLGNREGKIRSDDVWRALRLEKTEASPEQIRRVASALRVLGWTRSRRRASNGSREYCYTKGDSDTWISVDARPVRVT